MTHQAIQDLLEAYVDERLDPATRRTVDQHLRTCDDCREVLDGVAPVDLTPLGAGSWNETAMRRLVLRSLIRTAVNVAAIFLAGGLIILLLSQLVLQPLIVNRNGRAAAATIATADLAVMFNPGTAVDEYEFDSGLLSRTSSAHLIRPTGTALREVGRVESRIGIFDFGPVGGQPFPFLGNESGGTSDLTDHLNAVSDGTVATVEIYFDEPITIEAAQALADAPHDVRLIWAGFDVGDPLDGPPDRALAGWVGSTGIGYTTCDINPLDPEFVGSGGGGGSSSTFNLAPDIERARMETLRALANVAAHPELADGILSPDVDADAFAAARLRIDATPRVRSVTVTGPTSEILSFVADANPSFGAVRDIEFTNWFSPLCGR
jgi:hypothetical protein